MDAQAIIELLQLEPLPQEGGFYRETYRAPLELPEHATPECYHGPRNASTAIYFLLTPDEVSALHLLPTDEVFHFYCGDAVEMLFLHPDGEAEACTLGTDLARGQRPQIVVPGGSWQGCRLAEAARFALLGCTVAPGFDFRDFHVASPEEILGLAERFPDHATEIHRLAPRG